MLFQHNFLIQIYNTEKSEQFVVEEGDIIGVHRVNNSVNNTLSFAMYTSYESFRDLASIYTIANMYGVGTNFVDSDLPIGFVLSNPTLTNYFYGIALRPDVTYKYGMYTYLFSI